MSFEIRDISRLDIKRECTSQGWPLGPLDRRGTQTEVALTGLKGSRGEIEAWSLSSSVYCKGFRAAK